MQRTLDAAAYEHLTAVNKKGVRVALHRSPEQCAANRKPKVCGESKIPRIFLRTYQEEYEYFLFTCLLYVKKKNDKILVLYIRGVD